MLIWCARKIFKKRNAERCLYTLSKICWLLIIDHRWLSFFVYRRKHMTYGIRSQTYNSVFHLLSFTILVKNTWEHVEYLVYTSWSTIERWFLDLSYMRVKNLDGCLPKWRLHTCFILKGGKSCISLLDCTWFS